MTRGAKWFTDEEKERLREQLCHECEEYWRTCGYRKTSIAELTQRVGISTGAFYTLFSSKEELFLQTFYQVRERVKRNLNQIITANPTLDGAIEAVHYTYKEYDENPFLYDYASPDFWALVKRLPPGKWDEMQADSVDFLSVLIEKTDLTLKVSPQKFHSVIATIMYTITFKDKMPYDNSEVFDFLIECTFKEMFE